MFFFSIYVGPIGARLCVPWTYRTHRQLLSMQHSVLLLIECMRLLPEPDLPRVTLLVFLWMLILTFFFSWSIYDVNCTVLYNQVWAIILMPMRRFPHIILVLQNPFHRRLWSLIMHIWMWWWDTFQYHLVECPLNKIRQAILSMLSRLRMQVRLLSYWSALIDLGFRWSRIIPCSSSNKHELSNYSYFYPYRCPKQESKHWGNCWWCRWRNCRSRRYFWPNRLYSHPPSQGVRTNCSCHKQCICITAKSDEWFG